MNLLIIGASSFSGRHFARYARAKGAKVDEASLRNMREVAAALNRDVTHIANFAALNVVAPSWDYPSDYLFTNVYALTAVIDIMKRRKLNGFLHVSTPEVYGSTHGWVKEDAPFNPSTPYAVSRAAAEMQLACYHKEYGLPVVTTRACNVYGPEQQLYRLIPKLICSVKKKASFPLEGGGTSSRAFLHIEDACDAYWRVLEHGVAGSAYHVSSRDVQPIQAIAKHICARLGVRFEDAVTATPERPGKDSAYMLDSGRIRAELGWEDKVSMDEGLDSVIAWIERDWDKLEGASMAYEHRA